MILFIFIIKHTISIILDYQTNCIVNSKFTYSVLDSDRINPLTIFIRFHNQNKSIILAEQVIFGVSELNEEEILQFIVQNTLDLKILFNLKNVTENASLYQIQVQPLEWIQVQFDWIEEMIYIQSTQIVLKIQQDNFGYMFNNDIDQIYIQNQICLLKQTDQWPFLQQKKIQILPPSTLNIFQYRQLDILGFKFQLWIKNKEHQQNILSVHGFDKNIQFEIQIEEGFTQFLLYKSLKQIIIDSYPESNWFNIFYCSLYKHDFHQSVIIRITFFDRIFAHDDLVAVQASFDQQISFNNYANLYAEFIIEQSSQDKNHIYPVDWSKINNVFENKDQQNHLQNEFTPDARTGFQCLFSYILVNNICVRCPQLYNIFCLSCLSSSKEWVNKFQCRYELLNQIYAYIYLIEYFLEDDTFKILNIKQKRRFYVNSRKQIISNQIGEIFLSVHENKILVQTNSTLKLDKRTLQLLPCDIERYCKQPRKSNQNDLKLFLIRPNYYKYYEINVTIYKLFDEVMLNYQNINYLSIQEIIDSQNVEELIFVERFVMKIRNENINQMSLGQFQNLYNFKFWNTKTKVDIYFQANNLKVFVFHDQLAFNQNINGLEIANIKFITAVINFLFVQVKCQKIRLANFTIQGQISFLIYSSLFVVKNLCYISSKKQNINVFTFESINEKRHVRFQGLEINNLNLELGAIIAIEDQGDYLFEQIRIFNTILLASNFVYQCNKYSYLKINNVLLRNIHLLQYSYFIYSESKEFIFYDIIIIDSQFQQSCLAQFWNLMANNITQANVNYYQDSIIFLNNEKNSKIYFSSIYLNECVIVNSKFLEVVHEQFSVIEIEECYIEDIQYQQQDQTCLFVVRAEQVKFQNFYFNQSALYGCVFKLSAQYIKLLTISFMQINQDEQKKTIVYLPFVIVDRLNQLYVDDFYVSGMSVHFKRLIEINEEVIISSIQIINLSLLDILIQNGFGDQNFVQQLINIKQTQQSQTDFFNVKLTISQNNLNSIHQDYQKSIFNINTQGYINIYDIMINVISCTQSIGSIFNINAQEFAILSLKFSVQNCSSISSSLYYIQSNKIYIKSNLIIEFFNNSQYLGQFKQFSALLIEDLKLTRAGGSKDILYTYELFLIQQDYNQEIVNVEFKNLNIYKYTVQRHLIYILGNKISQLKFININLFQCQSKEDSLLSVLIQNAMFLFVSHVKVLYSMNMYNDGSFISVANFQKVLLQYIVLENTKCSKITVYCSNRLEIKNLFIRNSIFQDNLIRIINTNQLTVILNYVSLMNNTQSANEGIIIIIQGFRLNIQNFLILNMFSPNKYPLLKFNSSSINLEQFKFFNNYCYNSCLMFSPFSKIKIIQSLIANNHANTIIDSADIKLYINNTIFNNFLDNDDSTSIKLENRAILLIYDSNVVNNIGNNIISGKIMQNFSFFYQFENQKQIDNKIQNLSLIINNYNMNNNKIKYFYLPSGIDLQSYKRFSFESLQYTQYIYEFILLSKFSKNFILKSQTSNLIIQNGFFQVGINQQEFKIILDPYINQIGIVQIQGIENQTETFQFQVKTFPCQIGEIYRNSQCLQCEGPTIYSVAIKSQMCKIIDEQKVIESNLGLLNLKVGYWRPSIKNDLIVDCPQCKGGWQVGNKLCNQPYIGAMCFECDLYNIQGSGNFSKDQNQNCIKCGYNYQFWIYLGLLIGWQLITLMISVKSHVKVSSNYQILKFQSKFYEILNKLQVDQLQVLTKQMQLYLQVFTYMYQYNISNIILIISNPIQIVNSQTLCYGLYFQTNYSYLYILILFSNILINLSFYFILLTLAIKFKLIKYKPSYIFTPIFVMINFKAIILFDYISKLLTNVKISNISWVQANLTLQYFDNQHQFHLIWIITAFAILIVKFTLLFLYLFKNKSFLLNCRFYSVYGSIYKEYNRSKYYWEFMRLIFKIILVFLTRITFIYNRISTLIILTLTYLGLINIKKPFLLQNLNIHEETMSKMLILSCTLIMLVQTYQDIIYLIYIINFIYILYIIKIMIKVYSQNNIDQTDFIKNKIIYCIPFARKFKFFKLQKPQKVNARQKFRKIKTNFKVLNNRQKPKLSLNIEHITFPSENTSFSQENRLETQSKQIEMQQFNF